MNKLISTLKELQQAANVCNADFVLTRYIEGKSPDDLDILVQTVDFDKFVASLENLGYKSASHDGALGGRIKGAQLNLLKDARIKIDLHKDFTWRAAKYMDINLVWRNLEKISISNTQYNMPKKEYDAFLVLINILFEKTYINKAEILYINNNIDKINSNPIFFSQSEKYNWASSYLKMGSWLRKQEVKESIVFLPVELVIWSYLERLFKGGTFNLKSFAYYIFFRLRYSLKKTLPYE
jgi:hypothetical protein